MNNTLSLVAVDVSKNSLAIQMETEAFEIPNTKAGISKLIQKLHNMPSPFVVFEATGGYERLLMNMLHEDSIALCRANPSRVRAFATSEGIRAKTDPIDAQMILRFAKEKDLQPTLPSEPERVQLAALLDRRNHLKEQAAREKNRIQNSPEAIHASINRMLDILKQELKAIEEQIRETISSHPLMSSQVKCLLRITGIGDVTAWTVVAFLGEIQRLKRNQVVALAGVAPFNRDSGVFKGKRKIMGGRAKVRAVLYMATRTAATHNPVIKDYVDKLQERGKPYKCAIVAGMRKLLIHMHSELRNLELEVAS